ncbi:nitrate- and nitrite sensing domain-containing protein [Streptomyces sp. HUAS MG47]|uniref:sensor histidine kinase n=1 Tax=Streptomyces solicamelliae TaxID=3231716 RepID=UPI003877E034
MRTPRNTPDATAKPSAPETGPRARGRRAHAGRPADETPPPEAAPQPAPQGDAAEGAGKEAEPRRSGLRPRTVRAKIVSLLMVPVVSLLALWGFATVTTAQDVSRLRQLQRVDAEIRVPVSQALSALQAERRAAVRQIASPGAGRAAELKERAGRTDVALARLRLGDGHTVGDTGDLPPELGERVGRFVRQAEALRTLRTRATDGAGAGDKVYAAYTDAISSAFEVGGSLAALQDSRPGADARVLLEFARAGEMLSREDALLGSAQLTGSLSAPRLRLFTGAVATRRTLLATATADLRGGARDDWRALAGRDGLRQLTAAEDRILAAPAGRRAAQAVPAATWDAAHASVRDGLAAVERDARRAGAEAADPFAGGVFTAGGAAVLLGLAAVAASLVISVRIGRGLVVELISLRNTALEIARHKLPHAMRRLRAGEEIDVPAEAPPGLPAQDEIGQVGEALGIVHRAALGAAVERAELASGISGVFVNLARRSQVLVHRQLNLLDSMERRADDPNELGDLFRLDHLTTRMRRHAESLIILSGAAPGRAWRLPVQLTNVVRAAVSEIEDYARVEVRRLPETAVVGAAVADLTHLLAELIENAAQFSPPHTKVRISGEPVGNGYALEIEDRGLGMGPDTLAEANSRIRQSEALDLFDSDRLGLFVVSRLSSRHDVKVHLRTSPYGGTTAVVLIPTALLQGALPPGSRDAAQRSAAAEPEQRRERAERMGRVERAGVPAQRPVPPIDQPVRRALGGADGGAEPGQGAEAGLGADEQPPAPVTTLRLRSGPAAETQPRVETPPPAEPKGGEDGALPRRVRQASLVPQLRESPRSDPQPSRGPAADGRGERTPEQARDRMTAYREGWARGGGAVPGARRPLGTGFGTDGSEGDDA